MKIWKNYKVWGMLFLCFAVVWTWQATATKIIKAPVKTEKRILPSEIIPEMMPKADREYKSKSIPRVPPPPPVPVKEPFDVWGWIVKVCTGLTGVKTLLEIIDKFRKSKKNP